MERIEVPSCDGVVRTACGRGLVYQFGMLGIGVELTRRGIRFSDVGLASVDRDHVTLGEDPNPKAYKPVARPHKKRGRKPTANPSKQTLYNRAYKARKRAAAMTTVGS